MSDALLSDAAAAADADSQNKMLVLVERDLAEQKKMYVEISDGTELPAAKSAAEKKNAAAAADPSGAVNSGAAPATDAASPPAADDACVRRRRGNPGGKRGTYKCKICGKPKDGATDHKICQPRLLGQKGDVPVQIRTQILEAYQDHRPAGNGDQ